MDPLRRSEALLRLAAALLRVGRLPDAVESCETARELAEAGGSRTLAWRARLLLGTIQSETEPTNGAYERLRAEAMEAISELEQEGDDPALASAWSSLANAEWFPCHINQAATALQRAVDILRTSRAAASGDLRFVTNELLYALQCSPIPTAEVFERTESLFPLLGSGWIAEAMQLEDRAQLLSMTGDFAQARQLAERALETVREVGLRGGIASCLFTRGMIERRAGNPSGVVLYARELYEADVESGNVGSASTVAGALGEALAELGEFDEARRYGDIAMETSSEDDFASRVLALRVRAAVALHDGDRDDAEQAVEESLRLCEGVDWPEEVGITHLAAARVLLGLGQEDRALAAAKTAHDLFANKQIEPLTRRAQALVQQCTDRMQA